MNLVPDNYNILFFDRNPRISCLRVDDIVGARLVALRTADGAGMGLCMISTRKSALPESYWLMIKALIALSMSIALAACSGYNSAKQREICEQAYPNDRAKVDECVAIGNRQAVADAWPWSKAGKR